MMAPVPPARPDAREPRARPARPTTMRAPTTARPLAALALALAVALGVAACGGGGDTSVGESGAGGSTSPTAPPGQVEPAAPGTGGGSDGSDGSVGTGTTPPGSSSPGDPGDPDGTTSSPPMDPGAHPSSPPQGMPTQPVPGTTDPHPTHLDHVVVAEPTSPTLEVAFWGGVAPCSTLSHVDVVEGPATVEVTVWVGQGPEGGPEVACTAQALLYTTTVTLSAPLGAREVVDGAATR